VVNQYELATLLSDNLFEVGKSATSAHTNHDIYFCDWLIIAACGYVVPCITLVVVLIHVCRRMTDMLGFSPFLVMSVSSHFFHLNTFHGYMTIIFFQLVRHLGQEQLCAGL